MDFIKNIGVLLSNQKYMGMLFEGLGTTLLISVFAALIGLLLDTIAFGAIYFIISLFFMFIAKNSVKKEMVDR